MLINVFSNFGSWESDMVGHAMVAQVNTMNLENLKPVALQVWQEGTNRQFPEDTRFELTTDQARIQEIYDQEELSVFVQNDFSFVLTADPGDNTLLFLGFNII